MATFSDTPCEPWPYVLCQDLPTGSQDVSGYALEAATEILWILTGRRFGTCRLTLRPCRRECFDRGWSFPWMSEIGVDTWAGPFPVLHGGQWINVICGGCGDTCSCTSVSEARLPAPVADIIEVTLDGSPMPTGSYRVDNHRFLVRTDGGTWPRCNDLTLPVTEEGTWSVTLDVGERVPRLGELALGEVFHEMTRACMGQDCRLPRNVTQLARQDVTITMPDPNELLDNDKLGLFLADRFVMTYNPNHLRARARIYNPDRPIRWRRTT